MQASTAVTAARASILSTTSWGVGTKTLSDWLEKRGRVAIGGVDTRRLTREIRNQGAPHVALAHNPDGEFDIVPFPGGTGKVTEDRYEAILTHNRNLAPDLTLQIGGGYEYSKLAQSGDRGLTREFWRPKGSVTLAWAANPKLDLSFKLARTVGQLSFGTFANIRPRLYLFDPRGG